MTTLAQALAPPRERAGARVAYNAALLFGGSILMAGLAQVSIKLPFTPVPITGQTLGVLLIGASMAPVLGVGTIALYLAWAVIGLPVLAPQPDGSHVTGPEALGLATASAGYLWGFLVAAGVLGALSRRRWDRSMRSSISAMLLGGIVIYAFGLPWLMVSLDVPFSKALEWGLYPFVVGDAIKLFLAAGLLPLAWKLTRRDQA
jgi:biotin transport system substrate-specific component